MQCTSASIFGLEAALYLYYNRGSVVTCYDGSLEMCGGRRWGTPATMTFFYSPPVGPSSRKYPLTH